MQFSPLDIAFNYVSDFGIYSQQTFSFPSDLERVFQNTFWEISRDRLFSKIQNHKQILLKQKYFRESMAHFRMMFDPRGILVFRPNIFFESSGFQRNHKPLQNVHT